MPVPDPTPTSIFRQNVPDLFLVHTLERLGRAYGFGGDDVTVGYQREEAHDLLGHVVRAKFEGSWRALKNLEPHKSAGVQGDVQRNKRGTSFYTVMRCGIAAMTASAVEDPSTIVRHASFRNVFSDRSTLFEEVPLPEITAIYGLILHGRESKRNPAKLGFARVVFPVLDPLRMHICRYHYEHIDLMREFGSVVAATQGVPEEKVLDILRIELKKQKGIG